MLFLGYPGFSASVHLYLVQHVFTMVVSDAFLLALDASLSAGVVASRLQVHGLGSVVSSYSLFKPKSWQVECSCIARVLAGILVFYVEAKAHSYICYVYDTFLVLA